MEQSANDISHPVRDAFQELGHKARVAATSAYVALPVLMASVPAYGHETGQGHEHSTTGPAFVTGIATGLFIGEMLEWATRNRSRTEQGGVYLKAIGIGSLVAMGTYFLGNHF